MLDVDVTIEQFDDTPTQLSAAKLTFNVVEEGIRDWAPSSFEK